MIFFSVVVLNLLSLLGALAASTNYPTGNRTNPVIDAVVRGNLGRVKNLLRKRATDVDLKNSINQTPLMWAARYGNLEMVTFLVVRGANTNAKNDFGVSVLHHAAESGNLDVIRYLMSHGADISAIDIGNNSVLHIAARNGQLDAVKYLVEQLKMDPNARCSAQWTALHNAAHGCHLNVVRYLIDAGCDQSAVDVSRENALQIAAGSGCLDVVKYLLEEREMGENISQMVRDPLELAAGGGHLDVVKYLINWGILRSRPHSSALKEAASNGNLDIVQYLVEEVKMDLGNLPLYFATTNGYLDVVKYLLEHGAEFLDSLSGEEVTILHSAAQHGQTDIVQYLIEEMGMDINMVKSNGNTALHEASAKNNMDTVEYLLRKGADMHIKNKNGETAADVALLGAMHIFLQCGYEPSKVKTSRDTSEYVRDLLKTWQKRMDDNAETERKWKEMSGQNQKTRTQKIKKNWWRRFKDFLRRIFRMRTKEESIRRRELKLKQRKSQ